MNVMVALKHSEMRIIEDALDMGGGYVLNFSDRSFAEFFDDEFSIGIYSEKYAFNGTSKAKRMRAFVVTEDEYTVAHVLRRFWDHREAIPLYAEAKNCEPVRKRFFELLVKIEGGAAAPRTDAIDRFARDQTLEELVAAIERDIAANKPGPALDRLHTYCMKKFGHLLDRRGVSWERKEPLHSRVGKYVKALETTHPLRNASRQIIKNAIGVFEKFNYVRNDDSLAHDNELPDPAEARFLFDSIVAILRFIKNMEAGSFGT